MVRRGGGALTSRFAESVGAVAARHPETHRRLRTGPRKPEGPGGGRAIEDQRDVPVRVDQHAELADLELREGPDPTGGEGMPVDGGRLAGSFQLDVDPPTRSKAEAVEVPGSEVELH